MSMRPRHWPLLVLGYVVSGCGPGAPPETAPRPATGPLTVSVVYPALEPDSTGQLVARIASRDSAFVFGSVSRPDADVRVNGVAARVAPTGGWIAWVGLPDDTVAAFDVQARADSEATHLAFAARLPSRFVPPATEPWVDSTSLAPTGSLWVRPDEGVRVRVRASPGAGVRLVLPDSSAVPLVPAELAGVPAAGALAFDVVARPPRPAATMVYEGWVVGAAGADPGPLFEPAEADSGVPGLVLEVALGADTLRIPWPLRVGITDPHQPLTAVLDDRTDDAAADSDGIVTGRPAPVGTYHWFFPNGTRVVVDGRRNGRVRVRLSRRSVAWVDADAVRPLPPGTPPLVGTVDALRLFPDTGWVSLRVPLPGRVPFRVDEEPRRLVLTVYGVAANPNWIQYGPEDPLIRAIGFAAAAEDEAQVVLDLGEDVWGYRTRWVGRDLMLDVRRPPRLDPRRPLAGLHVALDAGHPPGGATGPTGAREADVALAITREAAALFAAAGARVTMIRDDTLPVDLGARPVAAERSGADLLVSIHANALPDGVNPFPNSGTSVYYFHRRAMPFARAVNRALVERFGARDLGIGRGDLALVRPTWMPAILTEGLFMMLPDHEAVLTSRDGQRRYAEGVVAGTRAYLSARMGAP